MNRRVLLVDGRAGDAPEEIHRVLRERFEVHVVDDAARALDACEQSGPFAVVVTTDRCDRERSWIDLLERFQRGWPDTARILVTHRDDMESAIEVLHRGAIFRLLREEATEAELVEAVESAVRRHRQSEEERLLTEQLLFCRESLLELTETLENRLMEQLRRMHRLQRYTLQLSEAATFEEIAELLATTCSRLLGERASLVLLEDATHNLQVERRSERPLSLRTHTEPIRTIEGEVGLIQVDERTSDGRPLGESERQMLTALACTTAQTAFNHIHRCSRDTAQEAVIHALSRLAENRDDETAKHLDRVSEYSRLIAEGLRQDKRHVATITDGFVRDLILSAPLHDIGKVGIPDSILLKPGALTEEEWNIMQKHPTIGAETLLHVIEKSGEHGFLRMALEIAWCHHERWDGGGYPRGLEAEEIPLAARIMALADVYDALTTWRPYKLPWTHAEAMVYLLEERGGHFDPFVVDAFVKRADQADRIRARLADEPGDFRRSMAGA